MRRSLFNLASAVSLLLCVTAVFLWAESYSVNDIIGWQTPVGLRGGFNRWGLKTIDGLCGVQHINADDGPYTERNHVPQPVSHGLVWESWTIQAADHSIYASGPHNAAGFGWGGHEWANYARFTEGYVIFPFWIPTGLTGILPGICLFRWRRRKRRLSHGQCISCGYDLRASQERCPECGTPISRSVHAHADV